jgi:hypothetical protein
VTGVLLDVDGESRLVGLAPDLGADEWPLPPANTPIEGLTAVNSSPTELGTATFLTGTIAAGTNVSYTWDLGDGTVGHGRLLSHTYSLTGTFTAVVTASNSLNTITATTPVVIAASLPAPSFTLYLPFMTKPAAIEICCSVER